MKMVIFKYPISLGRRCELTLPAGARILDVQKQGGWMLWALVNPDTLKTETLTIFTIGTGIAPADVEIDRLCYLKTIQEGPYVWHLFRNQPQAAAERHYRFDIAAPDPVYGADYDVAVQVVLLDPKSERRCQCGSTSFGKVTNSRMTHLRSAAAPAIPLVICCECGRFYSEQ